MNNPSLKQIEFGYLEGKRPRSAGCNARLPVHGQHVREPFARLYFDDGSTGFGFSRITKAQAQALIGQPLDALISLEDGSAAEALGVEFPLWDALGQQMNQPVYGLLSPDRAAADEPFSVPGYDTSLYFDDLDLDDDNAAAQRIADEAREGYARGHRAFKLKIGRGALHMPLMAGTQRDIAVIRAVRAAVGPGLPLMIDANNGYNVNLVKWVLSETADCEIYWLEEPFHEDRVLYEHLHSWLNQQRLPVLIADGEGQASPDLLSWARDGIVDVVQYDIRYYGFSAWIKTGRMLNDWGVLCAPHNYGSAYGNYAACHLAAALTHFTFAEWDQIELDGLDTRGYAIREGRVQVPDSAGFGLLLDDPTFTKSVRSEGFIVA